MTIQIVVTRTLHGMEGERLKGAPRSWLVQAAKLPTVEEDAHYPKVVALLFPTSYVKTNAIV